jgi:glycosyltransferase involved in cell wall biosynthesis
MKKILYIGRIAPYKGIDLLIKAWPKVKKACPQTKLLIRGQVSTGSQENYHHSLIKLINQSPAKDKIDYQPGWLTQSEKLKLIKTSEVMVCPSTHSEAFGILPVEGLKFNGIVVASDLFAKTGAVTERVAFVYPRNSSKELAKQIIKALTLSSREKRERKKRAKAWAQKFTWKRHIEELEKVFRRLIKKA